MNKSVASNVAITFGRLASLDPESLSKRFLDKVLKPWCLSIRNLKSGEEKESAFRGVCLMIPHNTLAALSQFPYLCNAFVLYKDPPASLNEMFGEIVHKFRNEIGT